MKIWMNGQIVAREDAKISVLDHGLLYGDGIFEGLRIYG
ncbi:MAG: branched-chain amino acid aminotransferase, partial [Deltaproteobacteria bacterium]|nr:branched-chain amino acid aminotransferase [Deltaproteobacteria bacterium]